MQDLLCNEATHSSARSYGGNYLKLGIKEREPSQYSSYSSALVHTYPAVWGDIRHAINPIAQVRNDAGIVDRREP